MYNTVRRKDSRENGKKNKIHQNHLHQLPLNCMSKMKKQRTENRNDDRLFCQGMIFSCSSSFKYLCVRNDIQCDFCHEI